MGEEPKLVWHRGKLAVSFTKDGYRFRRSLGTSDVAIGKARLAEYKRIHSAQAHTGPVTVATLYQAYVADRASDGKTITRMHDAWKRLAPFFGEMLPSFLNKEQVKRYTVSRRKDGVSDGTVHLELGYLRSAMIHAEKEAWITKAPFIKLPHKPPPREAYLTKVKAPEVIAAAAMPHVRLFIVLALSTAGRAGAILDLTWDRIDFDSRLINLRDPGKAATPKGRAVTPMNDMAFAALSDARAGALSEFVIEWKGGPVQSVKKGVSEAGRRAGVKLSPHMLRHSAAVWMAEDGIPMEVIAQYLGHTSPATTFRVYAKYSPEYLRKAAKALEL